MDEYRMECVCGKTWTGDFASLVDLRLAHERKSKCNGWPMIFDNPQAR